MLKNDKITIEVSEMDCHLLLVVYSSFIVVLASIVLCKMLIRGE